MKARGGELKRTLLREGSIPPSCQFTVIHAVGVHMVAVLAF